MTLNETNQRFAEQKDESLTFLTNFGTTTRASYHDIEMKCIEFLRTEYAKAG
jgi:hypothetical protein